MVNAVSSGEWQMDGVDRGGSSVARRTCQRVMGALHGYPPNPVQPCLPPELAGVLCPRAGESRAPVCEPDPRIGQSHACAGDSCAQLRAEVTAFVVPAIEA